MSEQHGDYPSPTASQSGPYPHRPTTAEAQLAHQLTQAMDHQSGSSDYSRPQGSTDAPMPWPSTAPPPPPQHSMAAPAPPPTQYAQYASDLQQAQQMTPGQASPGEDEPSKKKQKTSRACDECRRKKIKCDGDGEKPGYKCANCLRTNAECLYTKPAQKRGPSRGYIRELSDRVASLEELRVGMSPMTPQNPSSIFSESDSQGIKRTHSISEHGQSESLKTPYSAAISTPSIAPFARMGAATTNSADGATHGNVHFKMSTPISQPLTPAERSDLNSFMTSAQPRLPILPTEPQETEALLDAAGSPIRDTFFRCLKAVLALPASSDRTPYKQAFTSALELAQRAESLSPLANVVHLQICVLLLYISGTYGPVNPDTLDEPNEKILYGTVQGIASVLNLDDTAATSAPAKKGKDAAAASTNDIAAKHGRRAYGLFLYLSLWTALAHGTSLYADPSDFTPDALDGRIADGGKDAFLLAAMVPDLTRFHARFAAAAKKKSVYSEMGALFIDGVFLGLGLLRQDMDTLDAGAGVGKAAVEILRNVAAELPNTGKITGINPKLLEAATQVVSVYAEEPVPFFVAGHQTFALAVKVLLVAAKFADAKEKAVAALREARSVLDSGKLLAEDGWRGAIEKAVREGLKEKGDKSSAGSYADLVVGGWMKGFQ